MKVKNILINDFRESLLYPTEMLLKDSHEIRKYVTNRIAITNCKRILLSYPLLFVLLVHNLLFISSKAFTNIEYTVALLSGGMIAISTIYCAIIIWIIYLNDVANEKQLWKCKILHRSYWLLFTLLMFSMSFFMIYGYNRGIPFILSLLFLCLFPLYDILEYILTFVISIASIYIGMYHCGYALQDNNILFYALIALVIVSYFTQISQRNSVVLKEYISSISFLDPLTGLLNRRGASRYFEIEQKRMAPNSAISLFMIDIDFFKKYNDSFGHDAGDECLKAVAGCIRETLHTHTKLLVRQGGEEFLVILPNIDSQAASVLAETLRTAVYNLGLTTACQTVAPVITISMGVATTSYNSNFSIETLMKNADDALYRAKENGRNQVITFE